MRTTKAEIERCFQSLVKAFGKEKKEGQTHGYWLLDSAPGYGGYVVVEKLEAGGVRTITGDRKSGKEFCQCVRFFNTMRHELSREGKLELPW